MVSLQANVIMGLGVTKFYVILLITSRSSVPSDGSGHSLVYPGLAHILETKQFKELQHMLGKEDVVLVLHIEGMRHGCLFSKVSLRKFVRQ